MNNGQMTGAIFVDLSKAFDTLNHVQIIENLSSYGIYMDLKKNSLQIICLIANKLYVLVKSYPSFTM